MSDKQPKKPSLLERSKTKQFIDDGKIPNDDVVLMIGGKKVGSLGNFIALSGKQKSRKTAFVGALMGSAISGNEIFSISCDLPANKNKLLHIDTEQSQYDYKNSIDRLKKLSGLKKINKTTPFDSYRLRDWTSTEIKQFLNEYLAEHKDTGVVVIDGVIDLVTDFNSIEECKVLIDWLKHITEIYHILFVCIIHRSKSQNFSIGHLGSFIDRFAQSALEVFLGSPNEKEPNRNISSMRSEYMRSDGDFEPISITYDVTKQTWKQI